MTLGIILILFAASLVFLGFLFCSDNDYLEIGVGALTFSFILFSLAYSFIDNSKPKKVESPIPISSVTTNCETLVSKDGTVRVNIYTVHTNNVVTNNIIKLEKE